MSTKKTKPVVAVPRMTPKEIVAACERAIEQHVQKLEAGHGIKLDLASRGVVRDPEPNVGEITLLTNETKATINSLHTRIDLLFERLRPILRQEGTGTANQPTPGPSSELGGALFDNLELVRGAVARLDALEALIAL